jgi:hypothetical protein
MNAVVTDFVVQALYGGGYTAESSSILSWQQLKTLPFASWTEKHQAGYARQLLALVDRVHEQHCTRETFSSRSADNCKLFKT